MPPFWSLHSWRSEIERTRWKCGTTDEDKGVLDTRGRRVFFPFFFCSSRVCTASIALDLSRKKEKGIRPRLGCTTLFVPRISLECHFPQDSNLMFRGKWIFSYWQYPYGTFISLIEKPRVLARFPIYSFWVYRHGSDDETRVPPWNARIYLASCSPWQ